ncbi:TldD/PmbA family protein [Vallitalea pronyensis]|uniref:TldD/PmbA family protein n=1 Tax=Vallitalea pronyensis TaxID=1348613 RepID=A0A8J8MJS0_9FIRM|nr:TldD/PmbA family protein [Vallitalea pronyensis]QUI22553.1 TldD/PmbA family protein [Vallitalea pronyensis]
MHKKVFIEKLFQEGKSAGFEEMEVYTQGTQNLDIMTFKGDITKYAISEDEGLSFRGLCQGKIGYAYTEKLDENAVHMLVDQARDNAIILDHDDQEYIHGTGDIYQDVDHYHGSCETVSNEARIAFAKQMEETAYGYDKRVDTVNYCLLNSAKDHLQIINSKGLNLTDRSNVFIAYLSVIVKENEDVKTGAYFMVTNDYSKLDYHKIAKKAVDKGISMLGATSIESGHYPVILKAEASASILKAYAPMFSADNVHKDLSLLKGKLREQIADSCITIVDDPFMEDGIWSSAFDAEGVATTCKKLVDQGTLTTYLHNLKTAHKDGVASTGNAYRGSYKGAVNIAPSNLYIQKGSMDYEAMMKEMDYGIIISDVQGLHAGINTISGDFSISASGYEVAGGKICRPINQITMAGNYLELLSDITQVGTDLIFALPGSGYIGSPSLRIKSLSISGK